MVWQSSTNEDTAFPWWYYSADAFVTYLLHFRTWDVANPRTTMPFPNNLLSNFSICTAICQLFSSSTGHGDATSPISSYPTTRSPTSSNTGTANAYGYTSTRPTNPFPPTPCITTIGITTRTKNNHGHRSTRTTISYRPQCSQQSGQNQDQQQHGADRHYLDDAGTRSRSSGWTSLVWTPSNMARQRAHWSFVPVLNTSDTVFSIPITNKNR